MEKLAKLTTLDALPVIDRRAGLKLAGENPALADEIMTLFIRDLSPEVLAFHALLAEKNYAELQKRLHKLHGACCYTGTPRLKACLHHIETLLKMQEVADLPELLSQLDHEAQALMTQHMKNQP